MYVKYTFKRRMVCFRLFDIVAQHTCASMKVQESTKLAAVCYAFVLLWLFTVGSFTHAIYVLGKSDSFIHMNRGVPIFFYSVAFSMLLSDVFRIFYLLYKTHEGQWKYILCSAYNTRAYFRDYVYHPEENNYCGNYVKEDVCTVRMDFPKTNHSATANTDEEYECLQVDALE